MSWKSKWQTHDNCPSEWCPGKGRGTRVFQYVSLHMIKAHPLPPWIFDFPSSSYRTIQLLNTEWRLAVREQADPPPLESPSHRKDSQPNFDTARVDRTGLGNSWYENGKKGSKKERGEGFSNPGHARHRPPRSQTSRSALLCAVTVSRSGEKIKIKG